jgi:hypothetical protein
MEGINQMKTLNVILNLLKIILAFAVVINLNRLFGAYFNGATYKVHFDNFLTSVGWYVAIDGFKEFIELIKNDKELTK